MVGIGTMILNTRIWYQNVVQSAQFMRLKAINIDSDNYLPDKPAYWQK
jgi:hypothetical protein